MASKFKTAATKVKNLLPAFSTSAGTNGAKEILLTTSQMAFFIFNLFGHDIIHDAHPAMSAGTERVYDVLTTSDKEKLNTLSSPALSGSIGTEIEAAKKAAKAAKATATATATKTPAKTPATGKKKGGGNDDDDYLAFNEMTRENNKPDAELLEKSITNIVTSVGEELMTRKMLYAVSYKKMEEDDELQTLTFKDFQEKTFIIIDTERISTNFNKQTDDVTYPGDIFYKGKIIKFWKIKVEKKPKSNGYITVNWEDKESQINYSVTFNPDKSSFNGRIPGLHITENNDIANMLDFFILCTANDTSSYNSICSSFPAYINTLGKEFFYDTFVTFMENETYNSIDGLISMFPDYILSDNNSQNSSEKNFNKYKKVFDNFLGELTNKKNDTSLFNAYKAFYNNFIPVITSFDNSIKEPPPKNTYLKRTYHEDTNFLVPPIINKDNPLGDTIEVSDSEELKKKKRTSINKYITFLAKIFAGYFNKEYEDDTIQGHNFYERNIIPILQNDSCDINIRYVKNFLKMSSLYISSQIIDKELKPPKGGGNQSGGAGQIINIMTNDQKDILEDNKQTPQQKYNSIMNGVNPYDGLLEAGPINTYLTSMTASFNYQNVLNILLNNIISTITKSDADIERELLNAKNHWIQLFNLDDFASSQNYFTKIAESLKSSTNLEGILKMPPTQKANIMSIFKVNYKDATAISGTGINPPLSSDINQVLTQLYNFEQAFIVQLKIFLLYNYAKLNFPKGNPPPTPTNMTIFYSNFKQNFTKYYSIIQIMIKIKINKSGNFSQVQQVNTGCMVSSSVGVISYCIKQISATDINRLVDSDLDNEMTLLETLYLKKNLNKGSSGGDIDAKLITHFKKMISSNKFAFVGNSSFTISNSNDIKKSKAIIMDSINLPSIPNQNLYLINNAINTAGMSDFFCPYSSILDGQPTCKTYDSALDKDNPIEEGTINIIVRNGRPPTVETMRYHVRVKKSAKSGHWGANKKILQISAYLKIKDIVLINRGFDDEPTYNHTDNDKKPDDAIEVDLTGKEKSPFDAKECLKAIITNNINLLTIPGTPGTPDTIRTWSDFLKIINEDASGDVSTKGYGNISRNLFRRKIIQTSFIKSLGDYLQEINTVAENGGYIGPITNTPTNNGNTVLSPNTFRLGLSNDRPSGVRIATLLLFGLSGINPNAMGGFYTIQPSDKGTSGNYVIASRNKALLTKSGQIIGGGGSTKRRKNLTKKRKKLFKNKKMSKRNNKGTRKRK